MPSPFLISWVPTVLESPLWDCSVWNAKCVLLCLGRSSGLFVLKIKILKKSVNSVVISVVSYVLKCWKPDLVNVKLQKKFFLPPTHHLHVHTHTNTHMPIQSKTPICLRALAALSPGPKTGSTSYVLIVQTACTHTETHTHTQTHMHTHDEHLISAGGERQCW